MSSTNGQGTLRERILAIKDVASEVVMVPEWGLEVEVRSMTVLERAHAMDAWRGEDGGVELERFYPALTIACTYDPETGERLFNSSDTDELNGKNAAAVERIAQVAIRLSGMSQGAVDESGEGSS